MDKILNKCLVGTFILLYLAVATISCFHAFSFFGMMNVGWAALVLALAFEVAQSAVLFTLLTRQDKSKTMPWVLMAICTAVQCIGNVFSVYRHVQLHGMGQVRYFVDSVMWFIKDPDPQANIVILSYIGGCLLPLIALGLTGMVVDMAADPKKLRRNQDKRTKKIKPQVFL